MGKLEKKVRIPPTLRKKTLLKIYFPAFCFVVKESCQFVGYFVNVSSFVVIFFKKKKFDKKITKKTFPTLAIFNGMDQLEAE